jgi:hypothetical protein
METAHTGAALALLDMRFGENQHEHDSLSLGSPISEHYDDREKVCFVLFCLDLRNFIVFFIVMTNT